MGSGTAYVCTNLAKVLTQPRGYVSLIYMNTIVNLYIRFIKFIDTHVYPEHRIFDTSNERKPVDFSKYPINKFKKQNGSKRR